MTSLPVLKVYFGPLLQSAAFMLMDYINRLSQWPFKKQTVAKSSIQLEIFYMCNNVTVECVIADSEVYDATGSGENQAMLGSTILYVLDRKIIWYSSQSSIEIRNNWYNFNK